jgi:hypothetical protein
MVPHLIFTKYGISFYLGYGHLYRHAATTIIRFIGITILRPQQWLDAIFADV